MKSSSDSTTSVLPMIKFGHDGVRGGPAGGGFGAEGFSDIFGDVFGDIFGGGGARRGRSQVFQGRRSRLRTEGSISRRPSAGDSSHD